MPNKPIAYYHYTYPNTTDAKSHMTHTLDLDLLSFEFELDSYLLQLNSISKTEPHTTIFNTTPLHISTCARLAQAFTIVAKVNSLSVS